MTEKKSLPEQLASHTYPPEEHAHLAPEHMPERPSRPALRRERVAGSGEDEQSGRNGQGASSVQITQEKHNELIAKSSRNERYRQETLKRANGKYEVRRDMKDIRGTYIVQYERRRERHVTVPANDPSKAWNTFAQRQEARRQARANLTKSHRYVRMASRTFAKTGSHATEGRVRPRSLPAYRSTQIPARSGRMRGRRSFWWRFLALFAAAVILLLGASFAFTSNAFRIEQVNVVGTRSDVLIQSIQRMGMKGQNIFLVNVEAMAQRIEQLPLVNTANLNKQWPNILTVTVAERMPLLLWQTKQGLYSVDSQGVIFAPASDTPSANRLKTVFELGNAGNGKNGQQTIHLGTRLNRTDIAFAAQILQRLPEVPGISTFKLHYDGTMDANTSSDGVGSGSFTVESPDGWLAYLGSASDPNTLDNRLLELHQVLSLMQQERLNVATIDLRYGFHLVYTLKP